MSDDKWELVTDGEYVPQPGVDQLRFRYVDENAQWTDFGNWGGFLERRSIDGWRGQSGLRDYQFRRPRQSAETTSAQSESQPQPQCDWELITDPNHMLRIGIDQKRWRMRSSETGIWTKWTAWESAHSVIRVGDLPKDDTEWQCRKPKQQPEPEQPASVDRGERYQRRIYQSIDGFGKGSSIVVDLADVFHAFNVPYMLAQAVKKTVLPGDRGAKDRLKDLREAAWHIQRQIQIEEAKAESSGKWWHVVDGITGKLVAESDCRPYGAPEREAKP